MFGVPYQSQLRLHPLICLSGVGFASLAFLRQVFMAAATTTAKASENADLTTVAALRAAVVVVWLLLADANETRNAEALLAKPRQAMQSRQGRTSALDTFVMVGPIWIQ